MLQFVAKYFNIDHVKSLKTTGPSSGKKIKFIVDRIETRLFIKNKSKQEEFPLGNIKSKILNEDLYNFPIIEFDVFVYLITDEGNILENQSPLGNKFIMGYWGLINVDKDFYNQVCFIFFVNFLLFIFLIGFRKNRNANHHRQENVYHQNDEVYEDQQQEQIHQKILKMKKKMM